MQTVRKSSVICTRNHQCSIGESRFSGSCILPQMGKSEAGD